ncbi:MAG: helix-turn-helix transcriptional regulator [Erysipelotrichaceae bacterium]|nr:helix-turn-helix transcriptional regulator [Erysipelotrichaceae bacterium]
MDWSEKVKKMMSDRNMNQKELSEKSGITRASICRYLQGKRRPRIDVVVNFAKALGVEPEELLDEGEEIMSPLEAIKFSFARNGGELTEDEKKELVEMIMGKED